MKKSIEEEIKQLKKIVRWILFIGAGALLLIPILATQFNWFLDFTRTGQIGDTLGGTTAPVIGAVSALLIYFSFRAQINANRIIQNQIDDQKTEEASKKNFEHQMVRYNHLREHIVDFTFIDRKKEFINAGQDARKNPFKGSNGIKLFFTSIGQDYIVNRMVDFKRHEFSQIKVILSFYALIMNEIIPVKDDNDSKFIFNLIEILFYRHIWDHINNLSGKVLDEPKPINQEVFNLFNRIRDIEIELTKYKDIWPN